MKTLITGAVLGLTLTTAGTAHADVPWVLEQPLDSASQRIYYDVATTGPADIWVAGDEAPGVGVLSHWDGTRWADVPLGSAGTTELSKVEAPAANDVWVAGTTTKPGKAAVRLPGQLRKAGVSTVTAAAQASVVRHWDGTTWTDVKRADLPEGWQPSIADFKVAGEAWLVSSDFNTSTFETKPKVERLTATGWQEMTLPPGPAGQKVDPYRVDGTGPSDIWVGGVYRQDGKAVPVLNHWDGAKWQQIAMPSTRDYPDGWTFNALAADGSGAVYAVARPNAFNPTGIPVQIARWDGREWKQLADGPFDEVNGIVIDGAGTLWTAGWIEAGHTYLARWTGTEWYKDVLPEEATSKTDGSAVLGFATVPGTQALVTAGLFSSADFSRTWGMVASHGLR